ncbi:glycoside hydrolase family 12 protein [Ceratobasidium sp. AG-I]|nr:glycoside hydrolase family 12 protein [Ceratobasidium sp. AG-I]
MISKLAVFAAALLFGQTAVASPILDVRSSGLQKRFAVLSGQWDTETEGNGQYYLENNLWGKGDATSGSQTTQATSYSGTTVGWKTTYNWAGGPYNVKSYSNVALNTGLGKKLSSIKSIPTTWKWKYSSASSSLVADVSYDLWLSKSASGTGSSSTSTVEVMIWLSTRGGAGPAGSQIGTVTVGGKSWKLFKGTVSTWTVYSFVAGSELTSYTGDLKAFFTYLNKSQGVSLSQYLVGAQAGTEPFVGSATLATSAYTISVN